MLIPLLEDKAFLENLDDILAVEGLDALCFGPSDYALSLGLNLLHDFNHPKLVETFEKVVEVGKQKGLPIIAAVNPCTVEQSQKLSDTGVRFQLFGADLGLISAAFKDVMQNVVSKVR